MSKALLATATLLVLAACGAGRQNVPAIGEAYVGPISLNLRSELALRAEVTATVRHGDRLEILEYRRRFAKVRTDKGQEGWTDGRQLLKPEQMARLRRSAERAKHLASQGKATPFDLLNVHTEPNRQSPSFCQIPEDGHVDLVGHRVMPRVPYTPELRNTPAAVDPSTPMDSWSLVRLVDGRAGWVLSRLIMMGIPDEVAQYAEGHHITSYFSLGTVDDNGREKHNWLWTTIASASRLEPHQFDSFRIFVWSIRKHRYETAYIERNLKGYYPVEVQPAGASSPMAHFSLVFAGRDGVLFKRSYQFQENKVRLIAKSPYSIPVEEADDTEAPVTEPLQKQPPANTVVARVKNAIKGWLGR
ncbi:MAG: SH3 domain-containing protein [Acidobacteriia bacterium]|nr:SH3 domain-containing protein [Terriglobia bacterium]